MYSAAPPTPPFHPLAFLLCRVNNPRLPLGAPVWSWCLRGRDWENQSPILDFGCRLFGGAKWFLLRSTTWRIPVDVSGGWFGFEKGVVFAPTWRIRPHDFGSGEKKTWFFRKSPSSRGMWDPLPNTKLDDPPSTPPTQLERFSLGCLKPTKKKKKRKNWHPGGVNWPPAGGPVKTTRDFCKQNGEVWHPPLGISWTYPLYPPPQKKKTATH